MARTAGAVSNIGIKFQDLREILGDTFKGEVVVSAAWFEKLKKPCDFVVHKREEEPPAVPDVAQKDAKAVVVGPRPKFEID